MSVSDLAVVIFAGGKGTRIAEETHGLIPKPLIRIGPDPIISHVMWVYANQGCRDFFVLAGFQADRFREWIEQPPFADGLVSLGCRIVVLDTGLETQTGGRLRRAADLLDRPFFLTYGDGLADINLSALLDHHERVRARRRALATLTAVNPPTRFGAIQIRNGLCTVFLEKSNVEQGWINGGFYVIEPEIVRLIPGDTARFEYDVLPILASQGRLGAFQHPGYWQCMDTPRDLAALNEAYGDGKNAPWMRWRNDGG